MAGNCRKTRNNRIFPVPLNAPVGLFLAGAHSFSFNQKKKKRSEEKTEHLWLF